MSRNASVEQKVTLYAPGSNRGESSLQELSAIEQQVIAWYRFAREQKCDLVLNTNDEPVCDPATCRKLFLLSTERREFLTTPIPLKI